MEFFASQSKNAIFALLHVSNSYLFETWTAYPYAAGHFELIEVPLNALLCAACYAEANLLYKAFTHQIKEEELMTLDLVASGWALVYAEQLTVYDYPSPRRDVATRRRFLLRNAIWIAWLRRPLASALCHTLRKIIEALCDRSLAAGCLDALRGLPWMMR